MNEILARWKKCIEGPHIVPVLLKQGHLRQDQIDDLTSTKFTSTVTGWLERIFNESRIPDLVRLLLFNGNANQIKNKHLIRIFFFVLLFSLSLSLSLWPGSCPWKFSTVFVLFYCQTRRSKKHSFVCISRDRTSGAVPPVFQYSKIIWRVARCCSLRFRWFFRRR